MDTEDAAGSIKKPRRAEPIQPDKPGSGDDTESSEESQSADRLKKQEYQSDKALENVRKGYGN
jgi:hypothetical protein